MADNHSPDRKTNGDGGRRMGGDSERPQAGGERPQAGGERQQAERFGRRAETLCRLLLQLKGYRILASRLRTPLGEIDIVARRGQALAVVEVKGRRDWETAAESVTARQRARLVRAAHAFIAANPHLAGLPLRFDVMLVTPWALPRHIVDAWRSG